MQPKIGWFPKSPDCKVKRANYLDSERVSLLAPQKSLRPQLQLRLENGLECEDQKYPKDAAVAKEHRSQTTISTFLEQLPFVQSSIYNYHKCLPVYTRRFTMDITGGFSFLYSFSTEVEKWVEKQRKEIETSTRTELEALDVFLQSDDCKPTWSGLCS